MRFLGGARALGFSLVEIAIVLVVIGLIVSGGLLGLSPVLQANKISQTNAQMDKIEQTLMVYVIQNGCLPCPASPTGAGLESNGSTAATPVHCSAAACTVALGVLPWTALGLSKDAVIDSYGSFIDYTPSPLLTRSTTAMTRTPPSLYPTGALGVDDAAATSVTTVGAYVLISHGADRSNGYGPVNGALQTDPNTSTLQACNSLARTSCLGAIGTAYVQNQPLGITSPNGYFDDVVRFKTAPVIIQSCGSNACGNPA